MAFPVTNGALGAISSMRVGRYILDADVYLIFEEFL